MIKEEKLGRRGMVQQKNGNRRKAYNRDRKREVDTRFAGEVAAAISLRSASLRSTYTNSLSGE